MSIAEKLQQIADNVQRVFDAGKKEAGGWYDTFWDEYQTKGNRTQWNNAFSNNFWTDITYNPKYPITPIYYAASMFSASYITDTRFALKFTSLQKQEMDVFRYCRRLKTIQELTVSEHTTYQNWFGSCVALENITFNGKIGTNISFADSPLLTNESVQSVIDHLADLTGKTRQTLTLNAQVYVSDTQKAEIENLNWSLVQ